MPEEFASQPDMKKVIEEVESEVIAEQMKEAAAGKVLEELKDAEREFEAARQNLLRLTEKSILVYAAPALKSAEARLQDAEKLARDKMHAENTCGANSKALFDDVVAVKEEIEARRRALENARNRIDEFELVASETVGKARRVAEDDIEGRGGWATGRCEVSEFAPDCCRLGGKGAT